MSQRVSPTVVLLLVAGVLVACACDRAPTPRPEPEREPDAVVRVEPEPETRARLTVLPHGAEARATSPIIFVEVVATDAERRRGLGGRTYMSDGHGMLFAYPYARSRTFWMKDCEFALDIAFLGDDARILHVATLGPGAGKSGSDVPRVTCAEPVRFVLETNAGILAEHGVGTGDRIDVSGAMEGVVPE